MEIHGDQPGILNMGVRELNWVNFDSIHQLLEDDSEDTTRDKKMILQP